MEGVRSVFHSCWLSGLDCRPVKMKTSKLPIGTEVIKELRYWSKTYSVIRNFIVGIDHAAVCQSRCVEQVFLPFFPPLFIHPGNEEGWNPSR